MNKPTINFYKEGSNKVVVMSTYIGDLGIYEKIKTIHRFKSADLKTFKEAVEMACIEVLKSFGIKVKEFDEDSVALGFAILKAKYGKRINVVDRLKGVDKEIIYEEPFITIINDEDYLEVSQELRIEQC